MQLNMSSTVMRKSLGEKVLTIRNRHLLLFDLIIFSTMPALALYLRVESSSAMAGYLDALIAYTLIAVLVRCTIFGAMGIYRRFWRYASVEDLVQIGLALFFSSLVMLFIALAMRLLGVPSGSPLPRSVPIMESLLVAVATVAARFSLRLVDRWRIDQPQQRPQRVGIIGAGSAGIMILREMRRNPALGMLPVCFFDDDPAKQKLEIHGVPVWGDRNDRSRCGKGGSIGSDHPGHAHRARTHHSGTERNLSGRQNKNENDSGHLRVAKWELEH